MQKKIKTLLTQLNHGLVERENTLKAALLTVLAGENLLLIGPPGTGKSLIARRIADCLSAHPDDGHSNVDYFEYLLTKFSTPEEIFGPLSITELKADRFRRNTAGYLLTVQIAFLDEIFKASSSILNALLTILNERVYHNGAERQAVPLQALIAASNELPTDQEELSALYDRFLVRVFVDYVSPDNLPRLFDKTGDMPVFSPLTCADLHDIRHAAEAVTLPPEIIQAIQRIWAQHKETFKEDRREGLSDRRLKKLIKLLSVSAASNGRDKVDLSDVLLLKDCLWNHPDNAAKVREMVFNALRAFSRQVPRDNTLKETEPASSSRSPQENQNAAPKVKGYKGSGAAHDPLLIENIHDLAGLVRPEVGQQGHYFQQTTDIDLTDLSTWEGVLFKGYYSGNGHTIKYKEIEIETDKCLLSGFANLFECIQDQSRVSGIRLDKMLLAKNVNHSNIDCCSSNVGLTGSLNQSVVKNCLILVEDVDPNQFSGSIADEINSNSIVVSCFTSAATIVVTCNESTIKNCAIGASKINQDLRSVGRITNKTTGICLLENNISVDSNKLQRQSDPNGKDGRTVSATLFKQPYFEHTLGWDFDTVWQWDDANNRPALRPVGARTAELTPEPAAASANNTIDLLTQQIRANLWL